MQSIIQQLEGPWGAQLGLIVGGVLVGSVLVQSLILMLSSVGRLRGERRQREGASERLQLQIRAASMRCRQAEDTQGHWAGFRKFVVVRRELECDGVCSFYLAPHDKKPLPGFKPGQYLTFQLKIPGADKPIVRCYSLSDSPWHQDYYRVTIKRVLPSPDKPNEKPGRASNFFHDHVKVGDILDVKAPGGHFALDLIREAPVVLIGGGVGVTPVLSMLNALIESGSRREVHFFFGARNGNDHIQKAHLARVAKLHPNVAIHVCYSQPGPNDREGVDYHHAGRVSADLLKQLLPSNNYDFYICGPAPMMRTLTDGLRDWGVPDANVFFEAFGPATVKKVVTETVATQSPQTAFPQVTFSRSGKVVNWNSLIASLLDLAEANGVRMESGCRAGNCGTCSVAIKSGSVEYLGDQHGAVPEGGSCLACIARPKVDLVIEA